MCCAVIGCHGTRGRAGDGHLCFDRLEFERQQREELEKLEHKRSVDPGVEVEHHSQSMHMQ